jgi:hypothetical protein
VPLIDHRVGKSFERVVDLTQVLEASLSVSCRASCCSFACLPASDSGAGFVAHSSLSILLIGNISNVRRIDRVRSALLTGNPFASGLDNETARTIDTWIRQSDISYT